MKKSVTVKQGEDTSTIIREQEELGFVCTGREGNKLLFESVSPTGKTALND